VCKHCALPLMGLRCRIHQQQSAMSHHVQLTVKVSLSGAVGTFIAHGDTAWSLLDFSPQERARLCDEWLRWYGHCDLGPLETSATTSKIVRDRDRNALPPDSGVGGDQKHRLPCLESQFKVEKAGDRAAETKATVLEIRHPWDPKHTFEYVEASTAPQVGWPLFWQHLCYATERRLQVRLSVQLNSPWQAQPLQQRMGVFRDGHVRDGLKLQDSATPTYMILHACPVTDTHPRRRRRTRGAVQSRHAASVLITAHQLLADLKS
jgi:hypothetical protein